MDNSAYALVPGAIKRITDQPNLIPDAAYDAWAKLNKPLKDDGQRWGYVVISRNHFVQARQCLEADDACIMTIKGIQVIPSEAFKAACPDLWEKLTEQAAASIQRAVARSMGLDSLLK